MNPDQNNAQPVTSIPQPPVAPTPAPTVTPVSGQSAAPTIPPQIDAPSKNPKFMDTVKIFAIWGTVFFVIRDIITYAISIFSYHPYGYVVGLGVSTIIGVIISGIIFSAIGGVLFYFIYEPVKNWIKKNAFISGYIHSIFSLFWIPTLVVSVVAGVLSLLSVLTSGPLLLGVLLGVVANIIVCYFYAKIMSDKLKSRYQW